MARSLLRRLQMPKGASKTRRQFAACSDVGEPSAERQWNTIANDCGQCAMLELIWAGEQGTVEQVVHSERFLQ